MINKVYHFSPQRNFYFAYFYCIFAHQFLAFLPHSDFIIEEAVNLIHRPVMAIKLASSRLLTDDRVAIHFGLNSKRWGGGSQSQTIEGILWWAAASCEISAIDLDTFCYMFEFNYKLFVFNTFIKKSLSYLFNELILEASLCSLLFRTCEIN